MSTSKQIVRAIAALRPGAEYSMTEGVITWYILNGDPPTQAEIDAKIAEQEAADAAEATRLTNLKADSGVQDLIQRLQSATPEQIDTWLSNNCTTLAQAQAILAAIIKLLAWQVKRMTQ